MFLVLFFHKAFRHKRRAFLLFTKFNSHSIIRHNQAKAMVIKFLDHKFGIRLVAFKRSKYSIGFHKIILGDGRLTICHGKLLIGYFKGDSAVFRFPRAMQSFIGFSIGMASAHAQYYCAGYVYKYECKSFQYGIGS